MDKHTVWTIEGRIDPNRKDEYFSLMDEMVNDISNEHNALAYEWTMGEDGETIHVYERYINEEAQNKHLVTWNKFATRHQDIVHVHNFIVYSNLPTSLRNTVSERNPVYVKPMSVFEKFFSF